MKQFGLAAVVLLMATTPALARDDDYGVLDGPWSDKVAQAFFDTYPAAKKTLLARKLDKLLMPGGEVCDVPTRPSTGR